MKNLYILSLPLLLIFFPSIGNYDNDNIQQRSENQRKDSKGIVLYEHPNFKGKNTVVSESWAGSDIDEWDDRISSLSIPTGWTIVVYEQPNFQGKSEELQGNWTTHSVSDFWNDQISSFQVYSTRSANKDLNAVLLESDYEAYGGWIYLHNPTSNNYTVRLKITTPVFGGGVESRIEEHDISNRSKVPLGRTYVNSGGFLSPQYEKIIYEIIDIE
ncbi:beta/gamma crystallin-related protein [Sediminitomix flava]|uniref:Beta/gamma crystallin n=1 Tax=Sediminitomix flava TaxID=379075 RepID=A0A315ZH63_SEDFL|nr:beta/gamma crystallin-related protein [Sediminitomix flava]PWJ44851.1 beta/gamma crystallin [Sediminitomix flava]